MKYILFKPREHERNFIFSVVLMSVKMLFFAVLLIGLTGLGLVAGISKGWVDTSPTLDLAAIGAQAQTSFIYDGSGNLIMEFKGSENRIYVEIEDIPQQLINAVISVEDARFYEHHGVDLKRILGSMVNNVLGGSTQGASTITCQLVKLTLLNSEQTYKRKMQEAYLALELEKNLTKNQILEAYLNVIYMGGSSYGVKIAAQDYFGKDLNQLSLRECAAIARIIRNPSRYNPRSNYYRRHTPEVIEDNTDYVLSEMLEQRMISREEYDQARSERLNVVEKSTAASDNMYDNAYYVEYSIYDVVTKMLRVEGLEDNSLNRSSMETKLRNGGYKVFTSLNADVQKAVHDGLAHRRAAGRGGRAFRAGAAQAAQPRLSERHARGLVPEAPFGVRPGLRPGLFPGHPGFEPAHRHPRLGGRRGLPHQLRRGRLYGRGIHALFHQ